MLKRGNTYTLSNPDRPIEVTRGRYWYHLHLVLVHAERYKIGSVGGLEKVHDGCLQIASRNGFEDAVIVASNDLDERLIQSLKQQGATIGVWGVGTKLITAYDQPALGGVYKLGAVQSADGTWIPKIKLSEQLIKTSTPGKLQVRRYFDNPHKYPVGLERQLNELKTGMVLGVDHNMGRAE